MSTHPTTPQCEDTTFLLTSAVLNLSRASCYAVLGFYNDDGILYGHGYPIYYVPYLKKWAVLESTLDCEVPMLVWIRWNPEKYIPAIIFNKHEVYRMDIKPHREKFGLTDEWYRRYEEPIKAMIEYVEIGKPVPVWEYMHKGRRPVKVGLGDLIVETL